MTHSYFWRAVKAITSLWHCLLPVLDDATDLWLLVETYGGSHRGLWWTCLFVFVVADIERVYTAFVFIVLLVRVVLHRVICCVFQIPYNNNMSILEGQLVNLNRPWQILLDSLLWTLLGSRARSSLFMGALSGQAVGGFTEDTSSGLRRIDTMLFFHPMRYLGEFLMTFPSGHRREQVANLEAVERRKIAMVRAVGETLCVDPLFLALSVVTSGWDGNFTGLAMFSALFSMLELVTELQYYVEEAEATKPDEEDRETEVGLVNDGEVGGGGGDDQSR